MIVHFEMSGGYGGLYSANPLALHLNTDDLAADEADELQRLIADSGLTRTEASAPSGPSPVRDALEYRIQVVTGDGTHDHAFDDTTVPLEARPLIDHLRAMAMSRRADEA